jgi:hypothetical protein
MNRAPTRDSNKVILTRTAVFGLILLSSEILKSRIAYLYMFYAGQNLLSGAFFRFPMGRLCQFESLGGVLQSHFRVFMSGLMVALSVMLHRRAVSVCRKLVKFGGSLMRIVHRA